MMKRFVTFLILVQMGMSHDVYADDAVKKVSDMLGTELLNNDIMIFDDTDGRSDIGSKNTKIAINLNDDDGKATLRWTANSNGLGKHFNYEFKLQAPFDASKLANSTQASFDGLINAYEFTFGLVYSDYDLFDKLDEFRDHSESTQVVCDAYVAAKDKKSKVDKKEAESEQAKLCANILFTEGELGYKYKKLYWQAAGGKPTSVRAGINFTLGHESFDYVNADDTSLLISENKTPFSISASAALYGQDFFASLSYIHERSYKAGESKNLCTEFADQTSECINHIIGTPSQNTKHFAKAELRYRFGYDYFIQSILTYDFDLDKTQIEIPIQLYRDKQSDLGGGIKVTWNSIASEPTIGIYTGTKFGL